MENILSCLHGYHGVVIDVDDNNRSSHVSTFFTPDSRPRIRSSFVISWKVKSRDLSAVFSLSPKEKYIFCLCEPAEFSVDLNFKLAAEREELLELFYS